MKKQILEINRQLEACYIDAKEAQEQLCVLFNVSKCLCSEEQTTGWTEFKCCNICGKQISE